MTDAFIRRAVAGDRDAIVGMLRGIHAQHLAWDAARWTTSTAPHTSYAGWLAELADRPADGGAWVAEVDGAVAGYALAEVEAESIRHWSPRAMYVHDLFVTPQHRRLGLARQLMNEVLAWSAQTYPSLQVRLITAAANEPARAFFAGFGFRACAVEMIREGR